MSAFLQKRIGSFRNALRGLNRLIRAEVHARIHLMCSVVVIGFAVFFSISGVEWCLVIMSAGLVWTAEAFNTAIERVVDLASPGHNSIAGMAKDLAAGAVLLSTVTAAAIGLIVFIPRILAIL